MSKILIDEQQSKTFGLNMSFWTDLADFENQDCMSEYFYPFACYLKELEKKGFINPWEKIRDMDQSYQIDDGKST